MYFKDTYQHLTYIQLQNTYMRAASFFYKFMLRYLIDLLVRDTNIFKHKVPSIQDARACFMYAKTSFHIFYGLGFYEESKYTQTAEDPQEEFTCFLLRKCGIC